MDFDGGDDDAALLAMMDRLEHEHAAKRRAVEAEPAPRYAPLELTVSGAGVTPRPPQPNALELLRREKMAPARAPLARAAPGNDEREAPPDDGGASWIYPESDRFPRRDYQFNIVRTALQHNTMVCLPTGLGKTFIAATVMGNFFHWHPTRKIIFMAPTKPLVTQQADACYTQMGVPYEHISEMTGGSMPPAKRAAEWRDKRIFFVTPQVVKVSRVSHCRLSLTPPSLFPFTRTTCLAALSRPSRLCAWWWMRHTAPRATMRMCWWPAPLPRPVRTAALWR